jgi:hypothetical protein
MPDTAPFVPLKIDLKAIKCAFVSRESLSTFQRINQTADAIKAAKWAAYTPLTAMRPIHSMSDNPLFDSIIDEPPQVYLSPDHHDSPARSTLSGAMMAQVSGYLRPTEFTATLHALKLLKFMDEDPVIRLSPVRLQRWCIRCKTFHPKGMFARDDRNPSGLAFACRRCRNEGEHSVFRRSTYQPHVRGPKTVVMSRPVAALSKPISRSLMV